MIDYRVKTFLKLCEVMNYRKTAELLNMTQPAVTQHIHFLEKEYNCKLFSYDSKKLTKTSECEKLQIYLNSMYYENLHIKTMISSDKIRKISIGATKTIGDYTMESSILKLLKRDDIEIEFIIENTENLLKKLDSFELDIILVEGYFNKDKYDYLLIKKECFTGICSKNHKFANKKVDIKDVFNEKIILREDGSGTRKVFEQLLNNNGYTYDSFAKKAIISSFKLIESAVSMNCGISFVYDTIAKKNENIATFQIDGLDVFHEFNFVYLKNTSANKLLDFFDF